MDGALGQDVDLQGSAPVQSHAPCVALGKPTNLLLQMRNSSSALLGVL